MVDICLQPITVHNWKTCIGLTLTDHQMDFVPGNLYSIAEAQFYPDACPLAVYNESGVMVGFVLYGRDVETGKWKIFRLMIEASQQGKGYGRAAMQKVMARIASQPDGGEMLVCYKDANHAARRLYAGLGFVEQNVDETGRATALWTRASDQPAE